MLQPGSCSSQLTNYYRVSPCALATLVYLAATVPRVPPQPSPKLRCMDTRSGIFSPV
jgi:hypothetical protein